MRPQKNQNLLLILLALALFFVSPVKAQVTVGSLDPPHEFSILELVSNESGLRLPLLTEGERDNLDLGILTDPNIIEAAEGLVIFNTTSGCLEFWSGKTKGWISLCASIPPLGSKENPYLILTPEQLDDVRNKPDAHYRVGKNIDLTSYLASGGAGYAKWGADGWLPLGNATTPFTGSIDGDEYIISGLMIHRTVSTFGSVGLFGTVHEGTVKNINLGIDNINGGINTFVGGIVGRVYGDGALISNCSVTGGTITGGNSVGGVVGRVDFGSSVVTRCFASVDVKGANGIGGVVGQVSSDNTGDRGGSLTNCYSTGNVNGSTGVGGIAGRVQNGGSLMNCYATGAVSRGDNTTNPNANYIAGIAGRIDPHANLINCVALNSSVITNSGTSVARIVANAGGTGTQILNNYANSSMVILIGSGTPKSPLDDATGSGLDGLPLTTTEFNSAVWWQNSSHWNTTSPNSAWDFNIWKWDGNINLPVLK